ncbi:hypothetical protein PFBG_00149, partial [Plasmodium falciparum 7G8]
MAVKISTSVYKKRISSTAYPLYFSVFLKRLKNFVSERINKIKNLVDYEKSCRNLNYEIDEVKDLFCTGDFLNIPRYVRLASWNKNIEDHLKATMVSDSNQKCKRSYPFYPRIQRYRRKLLADYCEERDKRRREVISSSTDKDKCLEFNEWVIMNDNAITDSFNNNITEGDRNKGAYTINDNCSLRKPYILFQLLECHEGKKKEEEPEKKSDSDDEDLNKPKIPEQDHKNVIPGIIGFSNSPSYVGFNPVHAESGMFGHSSPGLTFDKLNMFFDSPIFGHSKITGTAEGFGNIFNMHIEPKDVAIPFDTSPPVSIPASNVTVGSNTPVKITPYLMFTPAVLLIVFISIILNLMNKKKPMIPVKIKEKIKVKSAVPSAEHIRIEELEKLREEMREKELEKLRKKIHVPKKVEIIEEPYKIKLLERKKWLWKTIIEIHMLILEEQRKAEWEFNKADFLHICIDEFSNQEKKSDINVIRKEEVLEDLKKDIYESDEMKEIEKYKGEDWFKQMQQDWIRRDYKFVSSYNLESDDEEQFHESVKKPTVEIQKDLLKEQWKNIEVKWINEDNYDEYVLEDELLKKTKYIKPKDKMKHRIIKEDDIYSEQLKVFDEIEKRSIYLSSKRVLKWKTIIEIHLEVLHDCKKEEWDKNKRDFLNICIEELVKGQNEDKKIKENYNYITNVRDNYDIVEYTKSFCNTWKDRHNYMLEKWNKENWFVQLKNDWKKEQNEYMRKTYKELLISLKGDKYNMSQRQKIIWKKWIAKHPNKMNEEIINIWSNQLSDEIDKNGIISDEAIKKFLSLEKDISDKDFLKYRRKKLEVILWIKIYMSVLEEQKNEELEKSKESFLNTCIDELKKEEYSEENERMITIVDEMKKGFRICDK